MALHFFAFYSISPLLQKEKHHTCIHTPCSKHESRAAERCSQFHGTSFLGFSHWKTTFPRQITPGAPTEAHPLRAVRPLTTERGSPAPGVPRNSPDDCYAAAENQTSHLV